jgi:hypothetical protein
MRKIISAIAIATIGKNLRVVLEAKTGRLIEVDDPDL